MNTLANLARVLSVTTGQGTLTLSPAVPGFNTFAGAGITDGQTVTYAIEDYSSDTPATVIGREIGAGVYSAGTLTRATVYSSTLGGAKLNCSGRQHVFITAAAEDFTALAADLTTHLNDTAGAHAASAISFTPAGNVASTDVQAAIAELDSEKLSAAAAASAYQPLDSDLTAIAALTSAANKVPYSTGAWTWALADFSAAGRALVDDADASAQRTTLGLGTAATYDIGTSGLTVPVLGGANTWSSTNNFGSGSAMGATVNIFNDVDFSAPLGLGSANDSANRGPNFLFRRSAPNPANNDDAGALLFQANDSTPAIQSYAIVHLRTVAVAAGAITGRIRFQTFVAGSFSIRAHLQAGLVLGSPTGDDQGTGTLNAVTLYENGTSLAAKYAALASSNTFTQPQKMPSYTVAGLPAGSAGLIAFASNGRKNGEGAGLGTGVLVFHDGTAWRACDTGATVAA